MGLKKYIAFSLILIVAVYVFTFSIQTNEYTVSVLDYSLKLPIAVWVIIPISLLFILTVLHIVFYGLKNYMQTNSMKKDEENIVEYFKDLALENNSNKKFKQASLKEMSEILSQLKFTPKNDKFTSKNSEIETIFNNIIKINNGEYVADKSTKFNKAGSLYQKNLLNRVKVDVDYAIDVVKKRENFSEDVVKAAFINIVENKSMTTIKKILEGLKLDKEMFEVLIEKDSKQTEFSLEQETIIKYAKEIDFDKSDYINLANLYKKTMKPDELIKMFDTISNENEQALEAYLVVLFEYEMIDTAREVLSGYADNEYKKYRALLDLKDSGKNYTLDTFCN